MPIRGLQGDFVSGEKVRDANVTAVKTLSNIMKTSLGPQGLDKMLVDDIGDVTVTNDGSTILKLLEVQHPAAKLLVDLSDLQDKEVGDGTTSVVIIAAELIKRGNDLVKNDIHPTSVISGYKLAVKEAVKYIEKNLCQKIDTLGRDVLLNIAKTTLSSKHIGVESDFFANLIVDAILSVKTKNVRGETKYPVTSINVVSSHGLSTRESYCVKGYAIHRLGRASQGMPKSVKDAKIAFLDFSLKQHRLQMGIQISIEDPKELELMRLREKDVIKERIQLILESGANVILSSEGIDDMALKYFVEAKAIAVRRVDKRHLRRIAKLTGGTVQLTLSNIDGIEKFEPKSLGTCAEVYEDSIGDWDSLFFKTNSEEGTSSKAATIILRGANEMMLSEVERSVHDALCSLSRSLESGSISPGGGAVEAALSIYLEDFARTLGSREQLAIAEFAEALLVIPKTLAMNAAQDSVELIANLRTLHARSQASSTTDSNVSDGKWFGLDLVEGKVRNSLTSGVVEPTLSKIKSLKFATEAAVTILRIDDLVKLQPEPEQ